MYYIYCYTNKVNGHTYVGQTNNLERRFREHKCSALNPNRSDYNLLFHQKLREYGLDNFNFEILEVIDTDDNEIANEREIYWIAEKESYVRTGKGYNLTTGGKNSSIIRKISLEEAKEIQDLLEKGVKNSIICEKYDIVDSYLSQINQGIYFHDSSRIYPIHKFYKTDEDYNELLELLRYSDLSLKEIAEKLGLGYSTVKKINTGSLRKGLSDTYPIRQRNFFQIRADRVKYLLINTVATTPEIMLETGVSEETVRRINLGITHKDNNLIYPLR